MRVLFIGGTGNLSLDSSRRALDLGYELYHLNRGLHPAAGLEGVRNLYADAGDEAAVGKALGTLEFDAVVDFIAYKPEQVARDIRLFRGRTGQYVFVSSASAYRKPAVHHVFTESTPLHNPFWQYSRDKIACEELLGQEWRASAFPMTIVRPAHTYGKTWIPSVWTSSDFTVAARMLAGKEVVVHGDGQSLWTLTHTRDFAVGLVGLLGNPAALGEAVQIAGDEALTWDVIHQTVARLLGVTPKLVHIPSEFIARIDAEMGERLLGDKMWSSVYDSSKIKRLVPDFRTTIPFRAGVRDSIAWFLADPARQKMNPKITEVMERVLGAWHRGLDSLG